MRKRYFNKNDALILPAVFLILLTACSSVSQVRAGEDMGHGYTQISQKQVQTETEFTEQAAEDAGAEMTVLTFDSFDGGGLEYTVEIEDLDIVSCKGTRDYGDAKHEEETGSSYTMTYAFTGLKQGETIVSIYGRSPIMENEDIFYEAVVDEKLQVKLTPVRMLSALDLYRNADMYYPAYKVWMEPEGYLMSVDNENALPFGREAVDALMQVVDQYDIDRWDGFDEEKTGVLDGESFWLNIRFTDGTGIEAQGDNAFPEHYYDAISSIQEILDEAAALK